MTYHNIDLQEAEQGKVPAVIGYIGPLFLVPLFAAKGNRFALYHANQGAILFILEIILGIINLILSFIPIIGWIVSAVTGLVCLIFAILGILNACKPAAEPLPIIGDLVEFIHSY